MVPFVTKYKEVNGTSYNVETDDKVIRVLEGARVTKKRLRIFLGDTDTGRDWMEENDTIGYIGRSSGSCKIPLLVKTSHSMGGGAILTHRIVRITEALGGRELYRHPKYYQHELFVPYETDVDDEYIVTTEDDVLACFKTREKALRWADFMRGVRNTK